MLGFNTTNQKSALCGKIWLLKNFLNEGKFSKRPSRLIVYFQ